MSLNMTALPSPPTHSAPEYLGPGRMPELDGLRAVAILLVLTFHATLSLPFAPVRTVTGFGWVGVDLFFVISGFLIGGILLDQREAANYYRVFYLRRFFRIVPLYAVVITPALVVIGLGLGSWFKGHSLEEAGAAVWLYPFFLQNIGAALLLNLPHHLGAAWSLAVEEQFYLLIAPLIRRVNALLLLRIILLGIFAAPLFRAILFSAFGYQAGVACYVLLPGRWDALLMGVLGAYVVRAQPMKDWLLTHLGSLRAVWLALAAGMGVMAATGYSWADPRIAISGYTWIAAFFTATLLLATLNRGGLFCRWLSLPALRPIATVSYGLYLLQGPVFAVIESFFRQNGLPPIGWTATGVNLLGVAATALAAAISWKFFESRFIRLGHQFRYQRGPEAAARNGHK
jgi:peptidoglycan/LPS O-acetylase OafA/YrhL